MSRVKSSSKRVLDAHSRQQWVAQLDDHVQSLSWSPDGVHLAAASVSGPITIFSGETGRVLHILPGHHFGICEVAWNASGTLLARVGQDGQARVWDPVSGEQRHTLPGGASRVEHLAWSPHARSIATGDQDATVHFWMTLTGKDLQMYGYSTKVRELSWDGTSRYLATGGSETVTIWDCSGKGPEGTRPIEVKGHATLVGAQAFFAHHGPLIATASSDGTLIFWQVDRPRRPLVQAVLDAGISQIVWSPNDECIAVGTEAGMVSVCTPPRFS